MMINVLLKTMKTMKKYSILLSATLAILALASCQKEQEIVNEETPNVEVIDNTPTSVPFVLRADIPSVNSEDPTDPETKTTLNTSTWAVDWESTDVIYAVTTDEAWGEAYPKAADETIAEFVYDSEKGTFSTDMAIADGRHTFNFLYTASQQKSYHRGASTTFSLAGTQTFDASAPTASLKLYDALAAQVTATTPTTFADVYMSHLFTLMKVTLKNKTGASVNISKFEVEIPGENLYGIFDVTFGTTPSAAYSKNGGDKITINISNGTVASGASLDVYFVMGAVSGYTGEVTFTVTDSASNTYTKTNTISGTGVTFAAGTYNTASYTLKTADPIECVTLDWDYAGGTASDLNAVPGVTTSGLGSDYAESHAPNRVKFDGTGDYIQVRTDAAISSVSVGFKKIGGAGNSTLTIKESANGSDWTDVQTLTLTGAQNATGTVTTTNPFDASSRFIQIYFTKEANVGIGTISIKKVNTDPVINITSSNPMEVSNATDLYAIEYSIVNPTSSAISASSNVAWIHDFDYSVDGEVAFEVDAQADGDPERSGVITLSYTGASDVIVTVNQAAGAGAVAKTYYTKVSTITSGKTYIMVDNSYSMVFNSASPEQPSVGVDASSLITANGIESTTTTDSYAVTITSDGTKYKVLLSTGKYLVINAKSDSNGTITESDAGESITITKVDEGFKFISGNRSTRALVYRNGYNFRNYAANNIGASGYGGYFDLYELDN